VRPFNVAGPGQSASKGFVLPTFCEQALGGWPLTVFGSGEQERAFTAVWDVADFIGRYAWNSEWDGRVFNLGNPANTTTILDLARRVLALSGRRENAYLLTTGQEVHGEDYAEADGFQKLPIIEEAQSLGWRPRYTLDDLIKATLEQTRLSPFVRMMSPDADAV
jgi:nucleoside-diphosphate-sugar epimerase